MGQIPPPPCFRFYEVFSTSILIMLFVLVPLGTDPMGPDAMNFFVLNDLYGSVIFP